MITSRLVQAAAATTALLLSCAATSTASTASVDVGGGDATVIRPAQLERGGDRFTPRAVYALGSAIHVGERVIRTDLRGHLGVLGRSGKSVMVSAYRQGSVKVWRVGPRGGTRLLIDNPDIRGIELSPDGRRLFYLVSTRGSTRLVMASASDGHRLARARVGDTAQLVDAGRRRALLSTRASARTLWLNPVSGNRVRVANQQAWFADVESDAMVLAVRGDNGYDGSCLRYTTVSNPGATTWYSCDHKPAAYSDSGDLMLTYAIEVDGLGSGRVQLRRADGTLLHTYRSGLFGSVGFDAADRLVLSAWRRNRSTVAVCLIDGGCRRISRVQADRRGDFLGPDSELRFSLEN